MTAPRIIGRPEPTPDPVHEIMRAMIKSMDARPVPAVRADEDRVADEERRQEVADNGQFGVGA